MWVEGLSPLNEQFDRGAFLVVDGHFSKVRNTDGIYAVIFQVIPRDRHSLDSLIDCTGTDSLHFGAPDFPHNTCDGPRNRGRSRFRRYFYNVRVP